MNSPLKGQLVPIGGGDTIPLLRSPLTMGRRESCDVCLRFPNVSGQHCALQFQDGVWHIHDMGSTNGTKVNGQRIVGNKALRPGDEIMIAKRRYTIQYTLAAGHQVFQDVLDEEDITSQSLMEKAGLERPARPGERRPRPGTPAPMEEDE